MVVVPSGAVDLYWIPLGAGHHSVRLNGIVYEAMMAMLERRERYQLFHSALAIGMDDGTYWAEMTPVPLHAPAERGVVGGGPVGVRVLGGLRLFRYEVRRWREGTVPDLAYAVESPVRVTDDAGAASRVFDALPQVPNLVWGRDEARVGDMWSCNSILSWTLARAGLDVDAIELPAHARAPGWAAGIAVARVNYGVASAVWTGHGRRRGVPRV